MLNVPILFLVFNRPDVTKKVFDSIRQVRPSRLYIAADGPRADRVNDVKLCDEVKKISAYVDWPCDVKTLFQNKNHGCKTAVSTAIDWFFEHESEGIVLEDDTLPDPSFYVFCEELLSKYKDDDRIWMIGGYKHPGLLSDDFSYTFTRYSPIWGWATWKRAWVNYKKDFNNYTDLKKNTLSNYEFFINAEQTCERIKLLDKMKRGEVDAWSYQWNFSMRINNGMAIRPAVNLVHNIGFDAGATHTTSKFDINSFNKANNIDFPLTHPNHFMVFLPNEDIFFKQYIKQNLWVRIKNKALSLCRKFEKCTS